MAFIDLYALVLIHYCKENKKLLELAKLHENIIKSLPSYVRFQKGNIYRQKPVYFLDLKEIYLKQQSIWNHCGKVGAVFCDPELPENISVSNAISFQANITNCVTEFIHANVMKQCSV